MLTHFRGGLAGRFVVSSAEAEDVDATSAEVEADSAPLQARPPQEPTTAEPTTADPATVAPARRGRGRPRVARARDETAIEKRRAQVRNAQRTYQKKKEDENASKIQRCDELLHVISAISASVESLLQTASETGALDRDDVLGASIAQLWSSYDTAINAPCLSPDLKLPQLENERRKAQHKDRPPIQSVANLEEAYDTPLNVLSSHDSAQATGDAQQTDPYVNIERQRERETTLILPFDSSRNELNPNAGPIHRVMHSRSIYEVVKARQDALRRSEQRGL